MRCDSSRFSFWQRSILTLGIFVIWALTAAAASAQAIDVTIFAGYNYVVDSNVESPSTYAPAVATVGARFCNYGATALTDVVGYIGDFGAGTPGVYPTRDSSTAAFQTEHSHLANTGLYSFTHVGGSLGTADAVRYMGDLGVGECKTQYWHMTYPRRGNPNNTGNAVWGATNDPDDDLWLTYDVWAVSAEGPTGEATRRATMRNEISANANKIFPNDSTWFNQPTNVQPGQTLTTNGINYELGVINKGFDNDGDLAFDYNAWLQPIGDASYDPTCFRLVKTEGQLIISRSGGQPDLIIDFVDQLYFTDLPDDNNGVRGVVYYTFMSMAGPCTTAITPYQEVASGADNEKFNGDYGTGLPRLDSGGPDVTLDKIVDLDSVLPGGTLTYTVTFENTADPASIPLGNPELGVPVVISDSIPAGTSYAAGSAGYSLSAGLTEGMRILYSTDGGTTWSSTEPATASTVTDLQWWLNEALPGGESGTVTFEVTVDNPFNDNPFIENVGSLGLGGGPPIVEDDALTVVEGPNSIGDTVFLDDGSGGGTALDGVQNGTEPGIASISVNLYWDKNGDGLLDGDDVFLSTTATDGSGNYSFPNLPDGDYIVVVDKTDADLPYGYSPTTADEIAVTDLGVGNASPVAFNDADFGFGPSLLLDKALVTADPAYEGDTVTYTITLTNTRPDNTGPCTYDIYPQQVTVASAGGTWTDTALSTGAPDGSYAFTTFGQGQSGNRSFRTGVWNFGTQLGTITQVELLLDVYVDGAYVNDELLAEGIFNNGGTSIFTCTFSSALGADGDLTPCSPDSASACQLTCDVTAARAWTFDDWSTMANVGIETRLDSNQTNAADGQVFVDAIGYRVTTDQTCGGEVGTDMDVVPLADTYNAGLLQFVSASPAVTSSSFTNTPYANTGVLSWSNVGPLPAASSTTVTVNFLALSPPDSDADGEADPASLPNGALSTGATFSNGDPVNDASDSVTSTLNPRGEITGTVWNDNGFGGGTSSNGVQDGAEQGIPGVTVQLYEDTNGDGVGDVLLATTVTDGNGDYAFTGLPDGDYVTQVVTATLPGATFTQTGDADQPGIPCTICDNDGSGTINLNDGDPATDSADLDYGYVIPNTVYGNVWEDNDGDGTQEAGENGIAGVTVRLFDCGANGVCGDGDDGATLTTTTDANGDYIFSDLPDGNYQVVVDSATAPLGATWTQTADPDATLDDSTTATLVVSGGQIFGAYDFGYTETGTAALGDTLFTDWDGDGIQDAGDEGIAGVTVTLYEDANGDGVIDPATDAVIATTVTDANGGYSFTGLPPGDYIVVVDETDPDLPSGANQTADPDDPAVPCTVCDGQAAVNLTVGEVDNTIDFGYQPTGFGAIGDFVWNDADADGIQDAGEAGIAFITVNLYEDSNGNGILDAADALVATQVTDTDGSYQFTGLAPGDYLVQVDEGDPQLPTDGNGDAYVLSTANSPLSVTLTAGQVYADADFGFSPGGSIGDTVYRDDDGNGDQSPSEPGIANVTVTLYDDVDGDGVYDPGTDTLIATTTTDANGNYSFTGLPAGDYVVVVDLADPDLPSTTVTADPDGTLNGETGVTLLPGQTVNFADFGVQPPGVLGDTLWIDADGDGLYDSLTEEGIAYVTVNLYNDVNGNGTYEPGTDTLLATTETDADGIYTFGDLADGNYVVVVDTADPDFPANVTQTYDPSAGQGNGCTVCDSVGGATITAGSSNFGIDFGYQKAMVAVLEIDKDTLTPTSYAGGTATYTLRVGNVGTLAATLVTLSDTLPAGFTYASTDSIVVTGGATRPTTSDPTVGTGTPSWGTWTIPVGASVTITFTVDIGVGVADGTYDNTASTTFDSDNNGATDTTVDDNGTQPQDAGTPPGMDPEDDEDVTIGPFPDLAVTKVSDVVGNAAAGDTITYTMTVTNNGTGTAHNVEVSDAVPAGTTYVASSIAVTTPADQPAETYADNFQTGTFPATSSGTLAWGSAWVRTSTTAITSQTDLGDLSMRIGTGGNNVRRPASLSAYSFATLSFDYRRVGLDNATDFVALEVSTDGGTTFPTEIARFAGTGVDDGAYLSVSYDLADYLVAGFQLRFRSSGLASNNEYLYVDNLVISVIARADETFPPSSPTPHDPPGFVVAADGHDLLPGETMTLTFQVVVDNPAPVGITSIDNTVYATSDETPEPRTASVSDPLTNPNTGSIGDRVWEDADADGTDNGGTEAGLENVRVELYDCGTGTCFDGDETLVAVDLTDATGAYLFEALPLTTYLVVVANGVPPGYNLTTMSDDPTGDALVVDLAVDGPTYLAADFGYQYDPVPLPVTLASFRSEDLGGNRVRFEWTTATEAGNVGFYIYGLTPGGWAPLSADIVPSSVLDSVVPQTYEVEAETLGASQFLVVDLDIDSRVRFHGPFLLGHAYNPDPIELDPIDWAAIHRELGARAAARRELAERAGRHLEGAELELRVAEDGLYRLTHEDLLAAGVDLTGAPVKDLALFRGGRPVPIHVEGNGQFGPGDAIEFLGEARETLYTDVEVYQLRLDRANALRIDLDRGNAPSRAVPPAFYLETVRTERDRAYSFASPNGDPFYDVWIQAIGGPASVDREITLDHYVAGAAPVTVAAEVWGVTSWPESPDHHLVLGVVGPGGGTTQVAEAFFDDRSPVLVSAAVPEGVLGEGPHTLRLAVPNDTGVPFDLVSLDAWSVTYPRAFEARDGRLTFTAAAEAFRVDGLPVDQVVVYRSQAGPGGRETVRRIEKVRVTGSPGAYSATFPGAATVATYRVAAVGSSLVPEVAPVRPLVDLLDAPADYLVISHPSFLGGLDDLVDAREAQGLTVKVVDVDDIYARYGGGAFDPRAIHDYIIDAYWQLGVRYVLLVGGDTYDYKDDLGVGSISFIPSLYVQTSDIVLFAPADPLYGDVDGDRLPDIPVGRLPVRTGAELASVIGKTLAYETKAYGETALLIADAYDGASGLDFAALTDDIEPTLAAGWQIDRVNLDDLGTAGARNAIREGIGEGVAFTQFFGHSGPTLWSFSQVFSTVDAENLTNAGLPTVIAQWGCWNTYYVVPTYNTLGHKLMLSGDRGAAVVLGAATLTQASSDVVLARALLPRITQPGVTLGEALIAAKRQVVSEDPALVDIILGWTILGDPALVLEP